MFGFFLIRGIELPFSENPNKKTADELLACSSAVTRWRRG